MPFPPNLFLIGAQKAGTTFLATLLGQHEGICLAEPKEPHFFTQNWERGERWYREFFTRPELQWLLDASPSYSAAPLPGQFEGRAKPHPTAGVPKRILDASPEARFIYIMRDPVKRAYSAYWHSVRAGDERRSFREAIHADGPYLRMGLYLYQLEQYFEFFDRERFLLLFFEDFIQDPFSNANRCLEWLGLDSLSSYEMSEGKNESYVYGPALKSLDRLLVRTGGVKQLAKKAKKFVPHQLLQMLRRSTTQAIPAMQASDRDWLANYYAEPNLELHRKLDLAHARWTRCQD